MRPCPNCGTPIDRTVAACPTCQEELVESVGLNPQSTQDALNPRRKKAAIDRKRRTRLGMILFGFLGCAFGVLWGIPGSVLGLLSGCALGYLLGLALPLLEAMDVG